MKSSAAPATSSIRFLPEVDGLRGIAILLVVLFHAGGLGGPLHLGWSGVQLFFVISGFLITRILIESRDRPHYFRNFYIRRALRIFPIYYLYLGVVVVMLLARGSTDNLETLPYYLTYTQTIPQLEERFGDVLSGTVHTWSLAIEEQFYWLWPFVVLWARGRWLTALCLLLFAGALITRIVMVAVSDNPYLVVGMLPVEMDSLAAGALLAVAVQQKLPRALLRRLGWLACALGGLGLVVLVALSPGLATFSSPVRWALHPQNVLLLTALAFLFAGVLALAIVPGPLATRVLTFRPLVLVGQRSYGIYLYHLRVLSIVHVAAGRLFANDPAIVGSGWFHALFVVVGLLVVYGVAELSWRFIEAPLLGLKDRFTRSESTSAKAYPVASSARAT